MSNMPICRQIVSLVQALEMNNMSNMYKPAYVLLLKILICICPATGKIGQCQ